MSEICGEKDVITPISEEDELIRKQLNYRGAQNYNIPYLNYKISDGLRLMAKGTKKKFYNHMPALEIKNYLPSRTWDSYFKFCFERNPYDKIISHYFWVDGPKRYGSILAYLRSRGYQEFKDNNMYSRQEDILVDKIFKFEKIHESLIEISEILNINPPLVLPDYRAKSTTRLDRRSPEEFLSLHEKKIIETIFKKEFQLLNYPILNRV